MLQIHILENTYKSMPSRFVIEIMQQNKEQIASVRVIFLWKILVFTVLTLEIERIQS